MRETNGRRRRHLPSRRVAGMAGVVSAILINVSAQPRAAPPPPTHPAPRPVDGGVTPASRVESDPLPTLLAEASQIYRHVKNYQCTFVKQERVGGRLMPEQTVEMAVRTEPRSVYLRFVAPAAVEGQEACYVADRDGGKMRVKGNGWKAALGFVSLDLDDPRAMRENRHTLAEAGIGPLLEQLARTCLTGKPGAVHVSPYTFDGRPCTRVEVIAPPGDPPTYAHRCVIYFDRQTKLPVRFEAYDCPRPDGPPSGELLECYSYLGLRFNVDLPDETFDK